MKLNVLAFGLACGLIWGLGVFLLPWWVMAFEGATHELMFLGHIYRGFNISPLGSVLGLLYGTCDGFIAGVLVAWLYNRFARCLACCGCGAEKPEQSSPQGSGPQGPTN